MVRSMLGGRPPQHVALTAQAHMMAIKAGLAGWAGTGQTLVLHTTMLLILRRTWCAHKDSTQGDDVSAFPHLMKNVTMWRHATCTYTERVLPVRFSCCNTSQQFTPTPWDGSCYRYHFVKTQCSTTANSSRQKHDCSNISNNTHSATPRQRSHAQA